MSAQTNTKSRIKEAHRRADAKLAKGKERRSLTISEAVAFWQEAFWQAYDELKREPLPKGWENIK